METFSQPFKQYNCYNDICDGCDDSHDDSTNICACPGDYSEVCQCDDTLSDFVCSATNTDSVITDSTHAPCPSGTWACRNYDTPGCGLFGDAAASAVCSIADPAQCPVITDLQGNNPINGKVAQFDPDNPSDLEFYCSSGDPSCSGLNYAKTGCTYDADDFDLIDYVTTWQAVAWDDDENEVAMQNLNDSIIPSICNRTASSVESGYEQHCPIDPTIPGGTTRMSDCSRMVLQDDPYGYGSLCAMWCTADNSNGDFVNQAACSSLSDDYCKANNTADCKCINRDNSSTFEALSKQPALLQANENCWWLPCSLEVNVPFLHGQDQVENPCDPDEEICAQVRVAVNNINTDISSGTSSGVISCGQSDSGGGGDQRDFNTMVLVLLGIAAILIIFVVITVIHSFYSHKKTSKKKTSTSNKKTSSTQKKK